MSHYQGWQDAAAVQRFLQGQKTAKTPVNVRRQPMPRGHVFSSVQRTDTGYVLIYNDWLPTISGHQVNRYARSKLSKRTQQVFGELPASFRDQRRARVEVIRVLGPRQKRMDRDSLAQLTAGLLDGITRGGYIRDDSEYHADITYDHDSSRRQNGPFLEIRIRYEG